jgi:hypothetical protein
MRRSKKKWLRAAAIGLVLLTIGLIGGFMIYVSDYSRADQTAITMLANDTALRQDGDLIIFPSTTPSETALIFYPGGKVDYKAYVPLLEKLRQNGLTCVLIKMPFNLAVFSVNAADQVYAKLPEIKTWYIGGHSLGGAMASAYAGKHQDKIKGLVLLGAYIYGGFDPKASLTLYGSEDRVLDRSKITYADHVDVINGGNHAQFGNYGVQKGDGTAAISWEQQQEITVQKIIDWIR